MSVTEFDGRVFNTEPSPPDPKDFPFELDTAAELPARFVVPGLGPVLNQGNTGTCGGHAGIGLRQFQEKRDGKGVIPGDPFALYDLCRAVMGSPDPARRLGTTARTVLRVLKGSGTPLKDGRRIGGISTYWRVANGEAAIKQAILRHGVVLVRCDWDAAWMRLPLTRVLRPPSGSLVGGHLFLLFGWNDAVNGGSFLLRNSWGRWSSRGTGNAYMRYRWFLAHRPEIWATTDVDD